MSRQMLVSAISAALLGTVGAAHPQAQQAQDFPDGPGKKTFTAICGGCHDINRVRVGYTPEGWHTVVRMMQNMEAPVPKDEWPVLTDYLIKNFPERSRPAAAVIP